jgi:hypothetical protein
VPQFYSLRTLKPLYLNSTGAWRLDVKEAQEKQILGRHTVDNRQKVILFQCSYYFGISRQRCPCIEEEGILISEYRGYSILRELTTTGRVKIPKEAVR